MHYTNFENQFPWKAKQVAWSTPLDASRPKHSHQHPPHRQTDPFHGCQHQQTSAPHGLFLRFLLDRGFLLGHGVGFLLGLGHGFGNLAIGNFLGVSVSIIRQNKSSPSTMMMPSCAFCKDCFSSSSMETLLQSSSGISITSVWPSDLLRILWAESSLSGFSQWFIMASKNSVTPAALEQQMRMRPPINKDRPKFKTYLVNGISRERLMGNSTMVDWAALRDGLSPESIRSTPARRRAWEKKILHCPWIMVYGNRVHGHAEHRSKFPHLQGSVGCWTHDKNSYKHACMSS